MCDNRLEELKDEKNYKSKDVAYSLNIAESTYSHWEHSKIPIPTKRLIELSKFYNVNIDYILNLSNKKTISWFNENNINLNIIGNKLKQIRQDQNMTLRELGKKLNFSFSTLASYERGESLIKSELLISLCLLYNVSIDWILGDTKNKYINKKQQL